MDERGGRREAPGRGKPAPPAPRLAAPRPERSRRRMTDVVGKLWGFCHTLRHDGIDHGDYIEQITYLLFLKMAAERGIDLSRVEHRTPRGEVDATDCSWPALRAR